MPAETVDPVAILAAIAANPNSSESDRIRACLALMDPTVEDYAKRKKHEVAEREGERQMQSQIFPDGVPDDEKYEQERRFFDGLSRANACAAAGLSS